MELIKFVFEEILVKTFANPSVGGPFAYIGWGLVIIIYGTLAIYDKGKNQNLKMERKKVRWNYPRALYYVGAFAILLHYFCIVEGYEPKFPILSSNLCISIGTLLMIVALALVFAGRIKLDGYWGPNIYEYGGTNNKLITDGIYKFMRHPIYSGHIIMSIATVFLLNNVIMFAFPLVIIPVNVRRAHREDAFLVKQFPDKFPSYNKETPFFGGPFG